MIKDLQTIQSEMKTLKLALENAIETIAKMEQHQSLLIASESQMKMTADDKDLLLVAKDAEFKCGNPPN